ncbi:Ypt/Rab-GAP domain of gyp1p superfamily protein [Rhynchospora pubera]|uniref:Ypt/Rab-GAP domain of gyp1p superfamily protein n=1 Tax=Rhynchospora pubera TaxID=906938 RepID=A0AAV8CR82_9POAL|nr:Ypt/Rab-GAP domain of gyp1p superfamily protein [Rhynchospora pubera]
MREIAAPIFTKERFLNLRGVRWRIDLGILPSAPGSIEEFRRVAADSRRRYVNLRRQLLIDPHLAKDESVVPDPAVENPLSQNPESTWGQFFRNAELEKEVNQDLSRLYPEIGDFFHDNSIQSMLGRILLVWCLTYPDFGYRQGMHELLAPLLYVLHVDLEFFSQIRNLHEKHFLTEFSTSPVRKKDALTLTPRIIDPEIRELFLLNDAYGAEGELGIILSDKFMEHDAFAMFDTVMHGLDGPVAIAEFYSMAPLADSNTGLTPVREAALSLYHLLSLVDSSLHSHLCELGVEPQYFAMRWLRVLFGRELSLENLLIIWDEIFIYTNETPKGYLTRDLDHISRVLCSSPRGLIILSMAVAMLLYLRPLLLSSEHATTCLQRLMNYPGDVDVKKLIEKARSIQEFALDVYLTSENQLGKRKSGTFLNSPNFWEEKWRVYQENESVDEKKSGNEPVTEKVKKVSIIEKLKWGFSKEKDVSKNNKEKKDRWGTIRRVILNENVVFDSKSVTRGDPSLSDEVTATQVTCNLNGSSNLSDSMESSSGVEKEEEGELEYGEDYKSILSGIEEMYNQIMKNGPGVNSHNCPYCEVGGNLEVVDKELMAKLRSLGQSMFDNIQVIESAVEQSKGMILENANSATSGGSKKKGVVAAVKELRKISSFLSEI